MSMTGEPRPLWQLVDPETGATAGTCSGPTADGGCPRQAEGRPVPCAGFALVAACRGRNARMLRLSVGVAETDCPVPILFAGGC